MSSLLKFKIEAKETEAWEVS